MPTGLHRIGHTQPTWGMKTDSVSVSACTVSQHRRVTAASLRLGMPAETYSKADLCNGEEERTPLATHLRSASVLCSRIPGRGSKQSLSGIPTCRMQKSAGKCRGSTFSERLNLANFQISLHFQRHPRFHRATEIPKTDLR